MSDTELRALTLLGFDELRQASGGIGSINRYGMHLGAATHFTLLNHPAVYERLRDWLAVQRLQQL